MAEKWTRGSRSQAMGSGNGLALRLCQVAQQVAVAAEIRGLCPRGRDRQPFVASAKIAAAGAAQHRLGDFIELSVGLAVMAVSPQIFICDAA